MPRDRALIGPKLPPDLNRKASTMYLPQILHGLSHVLIPHSRSLSYKIPSYIINESFEYDALEFKHLDIVSSKGSNSIQNVLLEVGLV